MADKTPLLETGETYKRGEYVLPGTGIKAYISLPFRIVFWLLLMCTIMPFYLVVALIAAIIKKLVWGKPSEILKYGSVGFPIGGMYYPAMMVFKKPFDKEKLRKHYLDLGAEAGIPADKMRLTFEEEVPRPFPRNSGAIEADHYVEMGTNWIQQHNKLHRPAPTATTGLGRGDICWLRVFNGKEGEPTVVNIGLNAMQWDGSSCFNFMKELVHRHTTGESHDLFRAPSTKKCPINEESAKKFDDGSFLRFLCCLILNTITNAATTFWNALKTCACFGGPGAGPFLFLINFNGDEAQFALINFDEADSAKLAAGCKKLGIKPFAAMTYSGVHAYKNVLKKMPHSLTQQSSLQTRHYREEGQGEERNFIGDWLVGPLQYPTKGYKLADAMEGYKTLLSDLDNVGQSVKNAIWAKAYCLISCGASIFEVGFWYPDDSRLSDSVFFNNYGIRSMHPDSGFVTWNWGAPFKLGFNTICVNGRTTITCATSYLGLPVLRAIRDDAEETLRKIMAGEDPH